MSTMYLCVGTVPFPDQEQWNVKGFTTREACEAFVKDITVEDGKARQRRTEAMAVVGQFPEPVMIENPLDPGRLVPLFETRYEVQEVAVVQ